MSRLGKKPIKIPEAVSVDIADDVVKAKGKLGEISVPVLPYIKVKLSEDNRMIIVSSEKTHKQARSNWGTMRSLIEQAVLGVANGFTKVLELVGVGYKAATEGKSLVLNIGFSHPVRFEIPENIKVSVEKNLIKISGINKGAVGQIASSVRKLKKPDPYQGKGIRYQGEVIFKKAGKKAVGAGTK